MASIVYNKMALPKNSQHLISYIKIIPLSARVYRNHFSISAQFNHHFDQMFSFFVKNSHI